MSEFFRAAKKAGKDPRAVVSGLAAGALLLAIAIWLPNLSFVEGTLAAPQFSPGTKIAILWSSLAALGTDFTPLSRDLTIALAVLFAIDVALLVFYVRTRIAFDRSAGVGIGGIVAGLLGVGCASCGTVVLSAFLGAGATAGFLNILPLKGEEFGFLGVLLMIVAIWLTAKKIEGPHSCAVEGD